MGRSGLGSPADLVADAVEHWGLDSLVGRTVGAMVRRSLDLLEGVASRCSRHQQCFKAVGDGGTY